MKFPGHSSHRPLGGTRKIIECRSGCEPDRFKRGSPTDKRDKDEIIGRYAERLKQHGVGIEAMASGVEAHRAIRYKVLSEVGDLKGASVLDLGCGFGDYYKYLVDNRIKVDYTGIDIVPDFIRICKERFPNANFLVMDIQEESPGKDFDYIVCSQVYNNKLNYSDNYQVIGDVLSRCYNLFNKGMAMDFVTSYVDYKQDHLFYYEPAKVLDLCKKLTKRVTLRHDYPLFEFMIYLYKDFKGWAGERKK